MPSGSLLLDAFKECSHVTHRKGMFQNLKKILPDNLQTSKTIIANIREKLKLDFREYWHQQIHNDSRSQYGNKLRHYRTLKQHFVKETYLSSLNQYSLRSKLANLRLSSHKLNIETGRYIRGTNRLPPEQRICQKCDQETCENEFHFIVECPHYSELRNSLMSTLVEKYNFIANYNQKDLYHWLMCNTDDFVLYLFSKFVKNAFIHRGNN